MNNNINTSHIKSGIQDKKPVLKPISELLSPEIQPLASLQPKDTFSKLAINRTLINPIDLFKNNSQNKSGKVLENLSLNFSHNNSITDNANISVIETGSSVQNVNAIKKYEGKTWLGKFASNGNRESAIIIPKGADYSKPFEIIYHFHGHNGELSNILTNKNTGLHDKIYDTAKNKNVIIVIPQGPSKEKDFTWFNGKYNEDMAKFQQDTMNAIKNNLAPNVKISSVTVEGHSAGGRPLLNASKEGKLNADKIDFLDASYGTWASETYNNYISKNPNVKFNVVYIPGTGTQADALSLKGKQGIQLTQSKVDHGSVPKTFFGI